MLFFSLLANVLPLAGQGWCESDGRIVLEKIDHDIASELLLYKTATAIDEINPTISVPLHLQLYYPTDLPNGERRPLVVLFHGGFFISGSLTDFVPLAQELAKAGFIAATVDYRLCQRGDCLLADLLDYPCSVSWSNSLLPSAYVAAVDGHDAIRFLQNSASQYHIDPTKVIVGGHSAGALTSLHLAYLDQDEVVAICSGCGVWPDYLAESLEPVSGIKAVISMSGMLYDLNWIDQDEASSVATLFLHGTNDGVTPYDHDEAAECCSGTPFPYMYGACPIAEHLDALNGSYELITGSACNHDISSYPFFEEAKAEMAAFLIKTVICQEPIQKHTEGACPNQDICPPLPLFSAIPADMCNMPLEPPFDIIVSTEEPTHSIPETIQIWANQNLLQITCSDPTQRELTVCISDVTGKVVYKQFFGHTRYNMDMSRWVSGVYVVQIFDAEKRLQAIEKVLKY